MMNMQSLSRINYYYTNDPLVDVRKIFVEDYKYLNLHFIDYWKEISPTLLDKDLTEEILDLFSTEFDLHLIPDVSVEDGYRLVESGFIEDAFKVAGSGFTKLFNIFYYILSKRGKSESYNIFIDYFDASLHPLLARHVIRRLVELIPGNVTLFIVLRDHSVYCPTKDTSLTEVVVE